MMDQTRAPLYEALERMYLLHHEELESLALHLNGIQRIRFFMTFGQSYLTHLKCLENVGMTSIEPIEFEGKQIVPLQFLKAVLPDPASLGPRTVGKTNIGCIFEGVKDGKPKTYYLYNVCDHQACYREVGSQAISYTTGVPAMVPRTTSLNGFFCSTRPTSAISARKIAPCPKISFTIKFSTAISKSSSNIRFEIYNYCCLS